MDLKIKNDVINIEKSGIYFLTGANGIGKTYSLEKTFLNMKKNQDVSFFSQTVPSFNTSVRDYLAFGYENFSLEVVYVYFEQLGLDRSYINMKFANLSGGEKQKISIVRCLLKTAKIYVFDEPSNNLDDESVEKIKELIYCIAAQKTVIIVSHDKRFSFGLGESIYESNNVSVEYLVVQVKESVDIETFDLKKQQFKLAFFRLLKKSILIFTSLLLIVGISLFTLYLDVWIYSNTSVTVKIAQNAILVQSSETACAENIGILSVEEKKCPGQNMDFPYLKKIKSDPRVDYILVENLKLIDQKNIEINESQAKSKIVKQSIPNIITENEVLKEGYACGAGRLLQGQMPLDYTKTATISTSDFAKKNSGEIKLNESKVDGYTITGINSINVMCVSYDGTEETFVSSKGENFDQKLDELNKFLIDGQYVYPNSPFTTLIVTKPGEETKLATEIMQEFNASTVITSESNAKLVRDKNKPIMQKAALVSLVFIVVNISFIFILFRQQFLNMFQYNQYLVNTLLNKNKIIYLNLLAILFYFSLISLSTIPLLQTIYLSIYSVYLLLPIILISYLFVVLIFAFKIKKWNITFTYSKDI
ncbi:MAG: ATP-binding cassette domain-containing protein [Mycoplasmatales bacterium]